MSNLFGILAEFDSPATLLRAAEEVRDAGYKNFDVYSPFPIHGMDAAMGMKPSFIPWIVLCGGATGLLFAFTLQSWVATAAYRLVISGKPFFSFQAFVPVTFELMVLFSAFSAVFGMFAVNKLPEWYHPLHKMKMFKTATSHGFFLAIESTDKHFNSASTSAFLKKIGGTNVSEVEE